VFRVSYISKKDGNRYRNIFIHSVDFSMYSRTKKLFEISMATCMVL
jgi:hypothetical protein